MKIDLSKAIQNFIPTANRPTIAWLHIIKNQEHFVGELTNIETEDGSTITLCFDKIVIVEPNGDGKATRWRPIGKTVTSDIRLERLEISRCLADELELYESAIGGGDRAILYTDMEKVRRAREILEQCRE